MSIYEHINDDEIYPVVPKGVALTIAPDELDDTSAFIKRPGLNCYEDVKGTDYVPNALLVEALIAEQVSRRNTPISFGTTAAVYDAAASRQLIWSVWTRVCRRPSFSSSTRPSSTPCSNRP